MPILKHAKKKLLVDQRRALENKAVRSKAASLVKKFRKSPSETLLKSVFSALDRAAKKNIYHENKANRLKSRLGKLLASKAEKVEKETKKVKTEVKRVTKKTVKKVVKVAKKK